MKKIIAYTIASFATLAVLLVFLNLDGWARMFAQLPFMKIDPYISGGQVIDSVKVDSCTAYIHEAVYSGLFSKGKNGYQQINVDAGFNGTLNADGTDYKISTCNDSISIAKYDNDSTLTMIQPMACKTKKGWIVRIARNRE